jgi:hypothetical protein
LATAWTWLRQRGPMTRSGRQPQGPCSPPSLRPRSDCAPGHAPQASEHDRRRKRPSNERHGAACGAIHSQPGPRPRGSPASLRTQQTQTSICRRDGSLSMRALVDSSVCRARIRRWTVDLQRQIHTSSRHLRRADAGAGTARQVSCSPR